MSKNILRKIQITFGIILLVIPSLVLAISVSHDESGNIYVPMSLSVTAKVPLLIKRRTFPFHSRD